MELVEKIMNSLRENPPAELAGMPVTYVGDYKTSVAKDIADKSAAGH